MHKLLRAGFLLNVTCKKWYNCLILVGRGAAPNWLQCQQVICTLVNNLLKNLCLTSDSISCHNTDNGCQL